MAFVFAASAAAAVLLLKAERQHEEEFYTHHQHQTNKVQNLTIIFINAGLNKLFLSGAVYVSQTSPYAAPSTSSSNIYSTPYEQNPQFSSQFDNPPAYDNSAYNSTYANPDNSVVDRKF